MAALIHRWPLTANANDVVGTLHLTNNGSVTFSDTDGASFNNGSSQWLSGTISLPSVMTMISWVKTSNIGTDMAVVAASDSGVGGTTGIRLYSGQVRYDYYGGLHKDFSSETTSANYPSDSYTLVAVIYDGTTIKSYRGTTELSASLVGTTPVLSTNFAIGRLGAYAGCYYNGNQKDIRIYDYALTAAEIAAIVAAGPNPSTSTTVLRLAQVF